MQQIELNTPFNLSLNMNDIINRPKNSLENRNDLKLLKSKIQNRNRLIKAPFPIYVEQLINNFKNNKSKYIFFIYLIYIFIFSNLIF